MTLDEFVFTRDDITRCQGFEEGLEEGCEKGREEGREEGIQAFIQDKVEDGVSEGRIIQKLVKYFPLDEDAARQYYAMFAK